MHNEFPRGLSPGRWRLRLPELQVKRPVQILNSTPAFHKAASHCVLGMAEDWCPSYDTSIAHTIQNRQTANAKPSEFCGNLGGLVLNLTPLPPSLAGKGENVSPSP